MDKSFRSVNIRRNDLQRGRSLYIKVVIFCATLKRIQNALVFMRQMQDLQLQIPLHLYLEVINHSTDVDDVATIENLLEDVSKLARLFIMVTNTHYYLIKYN